MLDGERAGGLASGARLSWRAGPYGSCARRLWRVIATKC